MNSLQRISVVIFYACEDLAEQDQRHVADVTNVAGFSRKAWDLLTLMVIE
jgi:hypothetical protein